MSDTNEHTSKSERMRLACEEAAREGRELTVRWSDGTTRRGVPRDSFDGWVVDGLLAWSASRLFDARPELIEPEPQPSTLTATDPEGMVRLLERAQREGLEVTATWPMRQAPQRGLVMMYANGSGTVGGRLFAHDQSEPGRSVTLHLREPARPDPTKLLRDAGCSCDFSPDTTSGPEQDYPVHGEREVAPSYACNLCRDTGTVAYESETEDVDLLCHRCSARHKANAPRGWRLDRRAPMNPAGTATMWLAVRADARFYFYTEHTGAHTEAWRSEYVGPRERLAFVRCEHSHEMAAARVLAALNAGVER